MCIPWNNLFNPKNWTEKENAVIFEKLGESMEFAGMAVAHLAMDPKKLIKSGRILLTSDLAREYGYQDFDGSIHDMLSIRELLNANVIRSFFLA